jgi:hypothetical protein
VVSYVYIYTFVSSPVVDSVLARSLALSLDFEVISRLVWYLWKPSRQKRRSSNCFGIVSACAPSPAGYMPHLRIQSYRVGGHMQ